MGRVVVDFVFGKVLVMLYGDFWWLEVVGGLRIWFFLLRFYEVEEVLGYFVFFEF